LEMFFDRAIYYASVGYEQEIAREVRNQACRGSNDVDVVGNGLQATAKNS
jgi:hypothetical protein